MRHGERGDVLRQIDVRSCTCEGPEGHRQEDAVGVRDAAAPSGEGPDGFTQIRSRRPREHDRVVAEAGVVVPQPLDRGRPPVGDGGDLIEEPESAAVRRRQFVSATRAIRRRSAADRPSAAK